MQRREALKYTALALGYSLSGLTASAILQGCKADLSSNWVPRTLTPEQVDWVAEMAETILPATDTPGAKDVLVHRFLDELLSDWAGPETKSQMLAGLELMQAYCVEKGGADLLSLEPEQRLSVLNELNERALTLTPMEEERLLERGFIAWKKVIIQAYFSSPQVGTEVLAYDPIPGEYRGNMPLSETDGRAWSL